MMIAKLCLIAALVTAASGWASAQVVNPLDELEASRRGSIEMDKRMKRDRDAQLRKDKERAAANVRQDAAAKRAASQPVAPGAAPARP
jgi:hypothetical protein